MKSIFLYLILCLWTVLGNAQQFPDRHSTSYTDAWLSCTPSANPNSDRGESHWIRYDLGATYVMSAITLWNYNDPMHLDNGVQDIAIDISSDGVNWMEAGTATINIAQGSSRYEGENIINLGGVPADYLLVTILSNHGGSCSGFSEIKVSSAVVLPIELGYQEARCIDDQRSVEITWQTLSEIGNDFFTIQKSENATDWFDLSDLAAKGGNGEGAKYSYIEEEVSGTYFYRIINTDLDGQRQYFDIMTTDCDSDISMTVVNPFTETLEITFNPISEGYSELSVESLDGKKVYNEIVQGDPNRISIPSSEWTTGTYIITIKQNSQYITQKVVKI